MTNEANPDPGPQAEMADPGVTCDQEVVPTPSCRKGLYLKEDQCLTPEGLKDHVQQTGNPLIAGEGLHPILPSLSNKLDLGQNSLLGAQQVRVAVKQDKKSRSRSRSKGRSRYSL